MREVAKEAYSKIGSVYCPLLEDHVHFTAQGFNHLIFKKRKFRVRSEQIRRFELISHLKSIVSDPKADIHLDDSGQARFWNIVRKIDGNKIRVVIVESSSRKIFLSVYSSL